MAERVYTDGVVFATSAFMEVYHTNLGVLDEEHFQKAVREGGFKLRRAQFEGVIGNKDVAGLEDYTISSDLGRGTLSLYSSLEATLRSALRMQDDYKFESTPNSPLLIEAFYVDRTLVGFRDYHSKSDGRPPLEFLNGDDSEFEEVLF